MELAHRRADREHQIGRLLQLGGIPRIGIEAEIFQRRRQDVVGGIEQINAAGLELGEVLRLEDDVPAVDLGVGPENFAHLLDVVADPGGAPHVVDRVQVAGIVGGEPLRDLRPKIDQVRQLALVELLKDPGLDLALEEKAGRHHHVIAGLAGQQLGLQRIVGIEGVVAHLDAGLLGEILDHGRLDIVRPIVDVDDLSLRAGGGGPQGSDRSRDGEGTMHGNSPGRFEGPRQPVSVSQPGRLPGQDAARQMGVVLIAPLLRGQRGGDRSPSRAAGEDDLPALRVGNRRPDRRRTTAPPRPPDSARARPRSAHARRPAACGPRSARGRPPRG